MQIGQLGLKEVLVISSNVSKYNKVLLALAAILLLFMAGFAAVKATSGANQQAKLAPDTIKGLQAQLEDYLKKETDRRHFKLTSQKITPTSQQSSGTDVAVVFDVERTTRLNYARVEDVPAMKGRFAFLKDNASQLSQDGLTIVNSNIKELRSNLEEYITTDQPSFERIKAEGKLDSNGKLLPDSIKLYMEGDGPGGKGIRYVPCDLILKDIRTPDPVQEERNAYDALKFITQKHKVN